MDTENAADRQILDALRKLVADGIEPGTFVILTGDAGRNYFIQFAVQDGLLYCEAVHNKYLQPSAQLSGPQVETLRRLGWREPETDAQNWFRVFRPRRTADYAKILTLVRRAFSEVYGLAVEAPLTLRTSWQGLAIAQDSPLEFQSEVHRSCYDKVARCGRELCPETMFLDEGLPLVVLRLGSLQILLHVNAIAMHTAAVDAYCWLSEEAPTDPDVWAWMLQKNESIRFGAVALTPGGDVVLRYSFIADSLPLDELKRLLATFCSTALELSEELQAVRIGGAFQNRRPQPAGASAGFLSRDGGLRFIVEGPNFAGEGDEVRIADAIRGGDLVWFQRAGPQLVLMRLAGDDVTGVVYAVETTFEPDTIRLTALVQRRVPSF